MLEELSQLVDIHYGKAPAFTSESETGVPVYGTGGIYGWASRSLFNGPAIVVPRKGSLGNPQYVEGPFWASDTTYALIPKRGVNARWIFYHLCAFDLTRLNEATGVPSISRDWLARSKFDRADPDIQERTANILHNTDRTISKTEALIAKYQQIKAGLMHDLFTSGLDTDGKIRSVLPSSWKNESVSNLISYISYGFTNPMPEALDGPLMVTAADIQDGEVCDWTCRHTERWAFDRLLTNKSRPIIGDLLITKDGTLGRVALVKCRDICINQSVAVLRPVDSTKGRWLYWLLQTPQYQDKMISEAGGSTIKHIYISVINKMAVPFPDDDHEAIEIVGRMESIDSILRTEVSNRDKLRSIKQGLSRALLTEAKSDGLPTT